MADTDSQLNSSKDAAAAVRIEAADAAHAAGIAVMPLVAREKKPAKAGWQNEPMPTPEEIEVWARQGNIGFRAGAISGGLFVIDVDRSWVTSR